MLHWLDRDQTLKAAARVPCRVLRAEDSLSAGAGDTGNMLIQGDNLHALKALLPYYRGAVKCVFIDPPYNTKSAFEHYADSLEHSKWLDMMYPRLELLRELLSEDGSIWVTIDDHEAHYLKVIMDEIFGRGNFVARTSPDARLNLGTAHDDILVYSKDVGKLALNKMQPNEEQKLAFKNPDNDPRGPWASTDFTGQTGHATSNQFYTIITPSGVKHPPPEGRCWALSEKTFYELMADGRVWFGKNGDSRPRLKRYLAEIEGVSSWTWWPNSEAGHNQESKKEVIALFDAENGFGTPKPERLIKRVLDIATNPGDLVLDSFLGSGTTAAVAHKMGRRYIGIELGEHARTHCALRLRKVIEGEQGGISKAVNWQGGGGFRFYTLGAELFDAAGNINPEVKFADLAAYLWFYETHTAWTGKADSPLLGVHEGKAYYLLYNGILKDRSAGGGNVLTRAILNSLPAHAGPRVIYGNATRVGAKHLHEAGVVFKQIPYGITSTDSPLRVGRRPVHERGRQAVPAPI